MALTRGGLSSPPRRLSASAWTLAGLAVCVAVVLRTPVTGDYSAELQPSIGALLAGHVGDAVRMAPIYGVSVLPRLPALFLVHVFGSGALGVYRAGAIACLLAAALLAGHLVARREGFADRLGIVLTVVGAPLLLDTVRMGHPEEPLVAATCVAAVLVALRGRAGWAGVALGVAVAMKPWAVVGVAPVLVALDGLRARARAIGLAVAAAGALIGPLMAIKGLDGSVSAGSGSLTAATVSHPQQLLWWLGTPKTFTVDGATHLVRVSPWFVDDYAKVVICGLGLPLGLLAWRAVVDGAPRHTALVLLALLLLARAALDPWDASYYIVPCVFALVAWELHARSSGLPVLALAVAVAAYLCFRLPITAHLTADTTAAIYAAWVLPVGAYLLACLAGWSPSALAARDRGGLRFSR